MGLGKKPIKLSLIHVPEMELKDKDPFYKTLFKKTYKSIVKYKDENGQLREIKHNEMLLRDNVILNKKNIKKIYKEVFIKKGKISNVNLVLIDTKRALDYILKEAYKGNYMVRRKKI